MRAVLSWLNEFAPLGDDVAALTEALSNLGLVVDGVEEFKANFPGVVVARVLSTAPHPDADRVQLVKVDAGEPEPLDIVCGAFNFKPGDFVPLATVGAVLPGNFEISRRKVRGQWSNGMLCSAAELRLPGDASGIMILGSADDAMVAGTDLAEAMKLSSDVVFDLDVTPNRPDALCHAGIARDLAAKLGVEFRLPFSSHLADVLVELGATTEVEPHISVAPDSGCDRFTALALSVPSDGLAQTPARMKNRLAMAGMRSISPIVDISNYVMLELGAPNHPYDLDELVNKSLIVRNGRPGESVTTLDDQQRSVGPADCLICDGEDSPVGIGGVMGGAHGEISASTSRVLLEMAHFNPERISATAKRVGLRTEASTRFERGCDPEGIEAAVARFVGLAGEILGARPISGLVDVRTGEPTQGRVKLRFDRVNQVLGTDLSAETILALLRPIGFVPTGEVDKSGGSAELVVPSWRPDASLEIDLIEEVARHHGYSQIERVIPRSKITGGLTNYQRDRRKARSVLIAAGLSEAWTTSLVAPEDAQTVGLETDSAVRVENPLVAEESVMRMALLPGLLKAVAHNANHRRLDAALFEIGHVFTRPPGVHRVTQGPQRPVEAERVAVAISQADAMAASRVYLALLDAFAIEEGRLDSTTTDIGAEEAVESVVLAHEPSAIGAGGGSAGWVPTTAGLHPTRSAVAMVGDLELGVVGEVDPDVLAQFGISTRVAYLELDLELMLTRAGRRVREMAPVSKFPSSDVDLAFVVPNDVPADAIMSTLRVAASDLLSEVTLFDIYRGPGVPEGTRSLTFGLRFNSHDHTLTDEEVGQARKECIDLVESAHGVSLRA